MLLNKEQVLQFLPHRDPFLFIDSVREVDTSACASQELKSARDLVGVRVIAEFEVRESLDVLKGHFPGNPILPGVVQIEMIAQASAFLSYPIIGKDLSSVDVETLLLAVEKSKFRKPLTPGMKLEVHARLGKVRGMMGWYEGEIICEGEKICEASLMAKIDIRKKEN